MFEMVVVRVLWSWHGAREGPLARLCVGLVYVCIRAQAGGSGPNFTQHHHSLRRKVGYEFWKVVVLERFCHGRTLSWMCLSFEGFCPGKNWNVFVLEGLPLSLFVPSSSKFLFVKLPWLH